MTEGSGHYGFRRFLSIQKFKGRGLVFLPKACTISFMSTKFVHSEYICVEKLVPNIVDVIIKCLCSCLLHSSCTNHIISHKIHIGHPRSIT